jgi:hypothetical protein
MITADVKRTTSTVGIEQYRGRLISLSRYGFRTVKSISPSILHFNVQKEYVRKRYLLAK